MPAVPNTDWACSSVLKGNAKFAALEPKRELQEEALSKTPARYVVPTDEVTAVRVGRPPTRLS